MNASLTSSRYPGLFGWIAICFAAAAIGATASAGAREFYSQLALPDWAPPGSIFAPVWSVLYLLMAISAWLVWRGEGFRGARWALMLFMLQLAANALWSWLFFAWHRGGLAFAEILMLWLLIVVTVVAFWRIRPLAAVLLLPYLAWVTFACALAYATWQKNPQYLG